MSSRIWLVGFIALAAWGCGPPEAVPIIPPGVEIPPPRTGNDENAAAALGEQRAQPSVPSTSNPPKEGLRPKMASPVIVPGVSAEPPPLAESTKVGEEKTTKSGLKYTTIREGRGDAVKAGTRVMVHYTGTFLDGKTFDTSRKTGQPFGFTIGDGRVIAGWDEGVAGMKIGEIRKLIVPPDLGYGSQPNPRIPANSTLQFEIELMGIQ